MNNVDKKIYVAPKTEYWPGSALNAIEAQMSGVPMATFPSVMGYKHVHGTNYAYYGDIGGGSNYSTKSHTVINNLPAGLTWENSAYDFSNPLRPFHKIGNYSHPSGGIVYRRVYLDKFGASAMYHALLANVRIDDLLTGLGATSSIVGAIVNSMTLAGVTISAATVAATIATWGGVLVAVSGVTLISESGKFLDKFVIK